MKNTNHPSRFQESTTLQNERPEYVSTESVVGGSVGLDVTKN